MKFQKISIIATEGIFALDPHPPGISNLVWHPLERQYPSKRLLHYTIMRKMIIPAIKKKNPLFNVNTVSNNLNFTLG